MADANAPPALSQNPDNKNTIIELKNGKVIFKQRPMSLEKLSETLQEIVKFRGMIEQRIQNQEPPLQSIPQEYLSLIAKLGHESDKTLAALAKHMQQELIPPQEGDEDSMLASAKSLLPISVVEQAIKSVLHRNNYGLEAFNGLRTPAAVCVWRWEVDENCKNSLPRSVREKVETRLQERIQAKEYLRQTFQALTQLEQNVILDPKGSSRGVPKNALSKQADLIQGIQSDNENANAPVKTHKSPDDEHQQDKTSQSGPGRSKKTKDPKKSAKEKGRQERKAAKIEKETKAKNAENKSRNLMANFFSKPKAPATSIKKVGESSTGPSRPQTDFERTFKPFLLKKGSTLAPLNWFREPGTRKRKGMASNSDPCTVVIDLEEGTEMDNDVVMLDAPKPSADVGTMTPQERLHNTLTSLHPSLHPLRLSRPKRSGPEFSFKTHIPYSVKDAITKLSEVEVTGDDDEVRLLLKQLQNRDLFPAKVLFYHEDARPGYFGTWTRSSKIIGPRRPFAKDVVEFDYGYDSGEEWAEEPMGDGEDVLDDDDEEAGSESGDSDMESWLVDDDEDPEMNIQDIRDLSPTIIPGCPDMPPPPPPPKRKAPEVDQRVKKRKVVVPLVPFAKGPCWETRIGECEYEPFNQYRIRTFNDTPFPIDPFSFVSTCVDDYKASIKAPALASTVLSVATNSPFVVSSFPETATSTSNSLNTTNVVKKPVVPLKNPFPDTHLPFLLTKISELQMPSFVLLVETIYQELKVHKVKKVAIEAKIREVGEKCKEKKVWIVKPTIQAQLKPRIGH